MKRLLAALLATLLPLSAFAEGKVLLKMTMWHLTPATDVATNYSATCRNRVYSLTTTTAPREPRAATVSLVIREGSESRTFNLTRTALGDLLTEGTGFGELRFACRPETLFVFYRGATAADATATPVQQQAVFAIAADGRLSIPPKEGITVTPVAD
jgi:hypothetical protein